MSSFAAVTGGCTGFHGGVMDIVFYAGYAFFAFSVASVGVSFLLRKRPVDCLLIYYLSLVLYFLPLFAGVVYDPVHAEYKLPSYIHYVVAGLAVLGVFFGEGIRLFFPRSIFPAFYVPSGVSGVFNLCISCFCIIVFFGILPALVFASDKRDMLERSGFPLMLISALLPVACVSVAGLRNKLPLVFLGLICLSLFFAGSRSVLVFLFLSFILLWFSGKSIVILAQFRMIFVCVVGLLFVISGKTFYGALMVGGLDGVSDWVNEFEYSSLWYGAEFLATGGILEEVIKTGYEIPGWVVPLSLVSFLPVPTSWFGTSSSIFNELFQPALFPSIEYGMAYSPWAEAFSWLGLPGVFCYSFLIPLFVVLFDGLWRSNKSNPFGAIFLMMGVTLAFWVHRNSAGSELAYLRNIFFPSLAVLLFSFVVGALFSRRANF